MIVQLTPADGVFAMYGDKGTVGTPVKVHFFALSDDGQISAFIIDDDGRLVPAETKHSYLGLSHSS